MRFLIVFALLISTAPAAAIEGMGNPWETVDNAVCAAMKIQDFAKDVGAAVTVTLSERVAESNGLPGYCRVVAVIAPKNNVEIRMPVSGWNGRVLMAGCGGLCGAVEMQRTDDALVRKYAVAHTDMGHTGADMAFVNDPAALEDYVHRSTHVATLLLKATVKAYYNKPQNFAYFRGCSTGGRQGLTAALMYPHDYDGIIAGAPAAGAAVPNIAWALKANTRVDGSSILDEAAIKTLHNAVLKTCDMDDGVADGIVGHPPVCRFEPSSIACGQTKGECLTPEQVTAAEKIYGGVPELGGQGLSKGGELGWVRGLVRTDKPAGFEGVARNYVRRFADLKTLNDLDFEKHKVRLAPVDALPDFGHDGKRIEAFAKSNGKLLLYHAWSDDSLTPSTALDVYHAHVQAFGGGDKLDPFFRTFVIPGMYHCRGGEGPDAVDFLSAMEAWVEKGEAPAQLIAVKPKQTVPLPAEYRLPLSDDQILFSRPVYPYPATAVYSGQGDAKTASSWRKQ
jgi:feruloyl esterase